MNDTAIGKHLPDISQLGLNELLKLRATIDTQLEENALLEQGKRVDGVIGIRSAFFATTTNRTKFLHLALCARNLSSLTSSRSFPSAERAEARPPA